MPEWNPQQMPRWMLRIAPNNTGVLEAGDEDVLRLHIDLSGRDLLHRVHE